MSRILPLHFDNNEFENEEINGICPRYIKWTKRVKAFDFSKRKKVTIERSMPSFDLKHKIEFEVSTTPKTSSSKSIFSRIRRGGRNLKVRCKTSAELWRRWIRGGILYSDVKEVDETISDDKENTDNNQTDESGREKQELEIDSTEGKKSDEKQGTNEDKLEVKTEKSEDKHPEQEKTGEDEDKNEDKLEVKTEKSEDKHPEQEKTGEDEDKNEDKLEVKTEKSEDKHPEQEKTGEDEEKNEDKTDAKTDKLDDKDAKRDKTDEKQELIEPEVVHSESMPEVVANNE